MEPAVKPAAEQTQTGVIGVITTQATYQGELFASVIDRFANGVEVVTAVCPEFVSLVEAGEFEGERTRQAAQTYLGPMLEAGIDHLVLGCTHFPFLEGAIREAVGPGVAIIDPSPAVARQTGRIIAEKRNAQDHIGRVAYFTSGDLEAFFALAQRLMDEPIERQQVRAVKWLDGEVMVAG
jgi:glutamate racemase